jgi:hypothetical protein
MTDGSTFSSGGDGRTFPANTDVYLSWDVFDAEQTPKKDIVNTFSAKQTFSVPSRGAVYATSGDLPAGGNGDHSAYVTADGVFYDYIAGAWSQRATGTTPNGSTTVAGKFEEATVAEQGSATATGATGARLVPAVANLVKTSSGAADENKIPVLNADGALAIGHIATGTPDGTKFVRDDGVLATPSVTSTDYVKVMSISNTVSASIGNATSATEFASHGITIAANDLIAGVVYEFEGHFRVSYGTNSTFGLGVKIGSNVRATSTVASTGGDIKHFFRGKIIGTTTAGAASSVEVYVETVSHAGGFAFSSVQANNEATNGTLAIAFTGIFGTGSGGHDAYLHFTKITKSSSTPF